MNNKDILMDTLETEKNLTIDMACALNEASNEIYYNEIFNMFTSINESAKDLFTIGSNLDYYTLEDISQKKLETTINELTEILNKEDEK